MMEVKVERIVSREEEVKKAVHWKFAQALQDCERIILPIAQALAPVRSGRYKRSLGYVVSEATLEGALYSGGKTAPHAHFVEWGTHTMPPFGTMRKAVELSRESMGRTVARRMEEAL